MIHQQHFKAYDQQSFSVDLIDANSGPSTYDNTNKTLARLRSVTNLKDDTQQSTCTFRFMPIPELDSLQRSAWGQYKSWALVLDELKAFETKYNLESRKFYSLYITDNLSRKIPGKDLRRWVKLHTLYVN